MREANVDVEYYIQLGLGRGGLLNDDGWQVETLRVLFQYEFEPDSGRRCDYNWQCSHYGQVYDMVGVQPRWQHVIERIKRVIDVDALSSNASIVQRVQGSSVENGFTVACQPSHSNIRNDDDLSLDPAPSGSNAAQVVPTSPAIDLDIPLSLLERNAVVCIRCWL